MRIESYLRMDDGIVIETTKGKLKICVIDSGVFHIVYTLEESFSNRKSLIIRREERKFSDWDIVETAEFLALATESMKLEIDKNTCAFTYMDKAGNVLVREPVKGGKALTATNVMKSVFDEQTEVSVGQGVDGIRSKVENSRQVLDRKAYHTKFELEWEEGEALYGLGSHEEGIMNLRGHHQYLYQQNMKAVVPVLLSTKGYGILFDSCSLMTFHDDLHGSYIWTDVDDEMDFYFIYGPEFEAIIRSYRSLTGKAPLLPKWAYGYIQSKERYETQDELINVVKEYREKRIPIDCIVLDWMSWTGDLWGQKSFDPERFPSPGTMMQQLHAMNAKLMISIWPNMRPGGENHKEMETSGYLLGNRTTYDAFNKKARELYWEQANKGLFSNGIDAWWCDCSEPFEADWKGELKPEPEERMIINTEEAKRYLDPEYINAYSLEHSKGIYHGQRETTAEKRVVNLTRSSFAGQHRYAAITWSGDVSANWKTLRKQIPAGLNFCATGEPYWTVDIGGFFAGGKSKWSRWCSDESIPAPWFLDGDYDDGCDDLGYRELYVRWFQYGAFLPLFRSHGTDTPREIWRFGEPGSIFYDTLVRFDYLRYRLIPYIYSLAGKVTHDDYTMMKPLAFDFINDPKTYNISDQYMFGPAFLVNPVTEPMYYRSGSKTIDSKEKVRQVYLPEGCNWYDFWTGKLYEGGQTIQSNATLDIMPLYIRSGSIIPMGPVVQHTGEWIDAPYELRIYCGSDGLFEIYEDEGDNYNYEKGFYSITRIQWLDEKRELIFEGRKGSFEDMANTRLYRIVLVSEGNGTGVNEETKADKVIKYDGMHMVIYF